MVVHFLAVADRIVFQRIEEITALVEILGLRNAVGLQLQADRPVLAGGQRAIQGTRNTG